MNPYIGHTSQLYGVEEHRLVGGKGDGMRLFQVRNGAGLEFTVSADRACDLSRLSFDGVNFGYFGPTGYVAPAYYDKEGAGFLKSFTAGFLTTCGLFSFGEPCEDGGETLGLHGTISQVPAEQISWWEKDGVIHIKALIRDTMTLAYEMLLEREYLVPVGGNTMTMIDRVTNLGPAEVPYQILYHFNVGYPLLSESAKLTLPTEKVTPQNDHAANHIATWQTIEPPTKGYEEMCFYHTMSGRAKVTLFNPDVQKGFTMEYDTDALPCFTQWKMMGERDYVMGVEPGNGTPDGRKVMRERGMLKFLQSGESAEQSITFTFLREE